MMECERQFKKNEFHDLIEKSSGYLEVKINIINTHIGLKISVRTNNSFSSIKQAIAI